MNIRVLDSFLQSKLWGQLKEDFGWQSYQRVIFSQQVLILTRLIGSLIPFAYLPQGAGNLPLKREGYQELRKIVGELPQSPCILRWDTPHLFSQLDECRAAQAVLTAAGFHQAPVDVQAPSTVMLDLAPEPITLLSNMKSKTRYNIRLSKKKGVKIRTVTSANLAQWYTLHQQTAERQGIAIRPLAYYQRIMELFPSRCSIASHENDMLAGILVIHWQKTATYLFGGSSNDKQNYMASYYLQWDAIQHAKDAGMRYYDFFGISRRPESSDALYGLYKFKTGFGGTIYHRPGCWDIDTRSILPSLMRSAERLRKVMHAIKRRRLI